MEAVSLTTNCNIYTWWGNTWRGINGVALGDGWMDGRRGFAENRTKEYVIPRVGKG